MNGPLSEAQRDEFAANGVLVVREFYPLEEIEELQRAIHAIIGLVIADHEIPVEQPPFSPADFDAGYQDIIAQDRKLGGLIYDAVKQIPAFVRLVSCRRNETVVRQLRRTEQPGIAAGGYGIRIDNPGESRFRANWHQDYPSQFRSLDGLVLWSPLVPVTADLGPVEFCLGSHKDGLAPIRLRDERNPDKTGAYGVTLADEAERIAQYERVAPLTNPGDLVVIDFLTLHQSGENRSRRSRWSMQLRWFNFEEATGRRIGWAGAFAAGNDLRSVHPELIVD